MRELWSCQRLGSTELHDRVRHVSEGYPHSMSHTADTTLRVGAQSPQHRPVTLPRNHSTVTLARNHNTITLPRNHTTVTTKEPHQRSDRSRMSTNWLVDTGKDKGQNGITLN